MDVGEGGVEGIGFGSAFDVDAELGVAFGPEPHPAAPLFVLLGITAIAS